MNENAQNDREQNSLYTQALKAAGIGVWSWNLKTQQFTWDNEMYRLHQSSTDFKLNQLDDWARLFHPEDRANFTRTVRIAIQEGMKLSHTFRLVRDKEQYQYLKLSADVFCNFSGTPTRIVGTCQDVTETMLLHQQLQQSNEELSSFAYTASHDLKSPLRGIKQLTSWIEADLKSPSQAVKENLSLIHNRIRRMEKLLHDLLEFSKISTQTHECSESEPVDTHTLVMEVFEFLNAPRTITLKTSGTFPTIRVNKARFELVMRNLVGNAIKHRTSPQGFVSVSAKQSDDNTYSFCICDDGEGIPKDFYDKIFGMFQTLKPKDHMEGSGMGLAIVKKIIETQGGKIWFESISPRDKSYLPTANPALANLSHGSCFYFTWPAENITTKPTDKIQRLQPVE